MKTFCGFIGWIVGMFIGFAIGESAPFLAFIFIIGGIFVGRYIGGCIEESKENERKQRELAEQQRRQRERDIQRKRERRNEALSLARKYPEATKHFFKIHWGISKSTINDYDITDDKVETLLSHKNTYESEERNLNATYRAKILAEQEALRKREAAKKEAERQAALARQKAEERARIAKLQMEEQEKKSLPNKVAGWNTLAGQFHYYSLLKYFPTTCDFEASEDEWEDRWTVWNFKNTPGKTSASAHKEALDNIIPRISSKLISTFGKSALKHITLVCIPASSAVKTEARYKEFSQRLCQETGMQNAYSYMTVTSSSQEKKFGGSGISTENVSFDSSFFRGKYVLLFDDVITRGGSMLKFKLKMEQLGAIVIGGMSVGRTTHNR